MGLNKQALLNLMSDPNEISERDVAELMEMVENYPYFQLGNSLLAKAKHDKQAPDAYKCLSKAAIYAPNRRMLRELFYENLHIEHTPSPRPSTEDDEIKEESVEDTNLSDEDVFNTPESDAPSLENDENAFVKDQDEEIVQSEIIQSDEVYDELEENLRKLRESKTKFSEEEEEAKKKIANEAEPEDLETQQHSEEEKDTQDQDKSSSMLLDQLTHQEEVFKPLGTNQQQQNELIDKFINSQDSTSFKIKPPVDTDEDAEDLSSQSTEVADNLVSENLAEIYVKQGKKSKAIEIYHKLIWKFPQKKAYFADKIESLKAE